MTIRGVSDPTPSVQPASGLSWLTASPTAGSSLSLSWTRSASTDLSDQKIQYYADAMCATASGAPVTLGSATQQVATFNAPADGSYTFQVISVSSAGETGTSACSSSIVVDRSEATPTSITLQSPAVSPGSDSTPTVRIAGVSSGATVRLYADATCSSTVVASGTATGATIDLTSSALAAGAYDFYATSEDALGNLSSCSTATVHYVYSLPPAAATLLGWLESSPALSPQLTAAWERSTAANLADQKIQFYADGTCGTTSGSVIVLGSADTQNRLYTGAIGGTYSFKVTSVNSDGIETDSACSGAINVSAPALRILPAYLHWPVGQALSTTLTASGGSGSGYGFTVSSGPGSIHPTSGLLTSGAGGRLPLQQTVVQATDGAAATTTSMIKHVRMAVSGVVYATAMDATSIYVGGEFNRVNANPAYGMAGVDKDTGALTDPGLASSFDGPVLAMAISGDTAYFGGLFTRYRGTPVQNLVKIHLPTGTLDTAFSQSSGPAAAVKSIAISGPWVYIGGSFDSYRGDTKGYRVAKLNAVTGALDTTLFNTTANSGPSADINSIVPAGKWLYIGGSFSSYRSDNRGTNLARIDARTGALDTASFNTTAGQGPGGQVYSMALAGGYLYVGGQFTTYRGDSRGHYIAKVDALTGALETTQFHTTGYTGPSSSVNALLLNGNSLYLGGFIMSYNGDNRGRGVVKVNATTGALDTTFNSVANGGPNTDVRALALSGNSLYVGGGFDNYRSDTRGYRLVKVDATTGVLDTAQFNVNSNEGPYGQTSSYNNNTVYPVVALAVSGQTLYLGGEFMGYRGGTAAQNIAKFDRATGQLDMTFHRYPAFNSTVRALALSGSDLFVGGDFLSYAGSNNPIYLAKLNSSTGALDTASFNSAAVGPSSQVYSLAINGGDLFVGGPFTSYRGDNRGYHLAKVNATTGVLDTTFNSTASSGPESNVWAMAIGSGSLYIAGGFLNYRGDANGRYLAKVDLATGAMDTGFNSTPGPNATTYALAHSGTALFVGGSFSTYRGSAYRNLVKVDPATGAPDTTDFHTTTAGPDNTVDALAYSGGYLYVGGIFRSYRNDTNLFRLVKISATTGVAETASFHSAGTGVGYYPAYNATPGFKSFSVDGTSVLAGGWFMNYRANTGSPSLLLLDPTTGAEQ